MKANDFPVGTKVQIKLAPVQPVERFPGIVKKVDADLNLVYVERPNGMSGWVHPDSLEKTDIETDVECGITESTRRAWIGESNGS